MKSIENDALERIVKTLEELLETAANEQCGFVLTVQILSDDPSEEKGRYTSTNLLPHLAKQLADETSKALDYYVDETVH